MSWIDSSNNLWLFGGYGHDSTQEGLLNDLWQYSISNNQWTWVSGNNIVNQNGVYGSLINNIPGSRSSSIPWIDSNNLLLFGGQGFDSIGDNGALNDLWEYSISNNEWTWISGNNTIDQFGIYGTQGISSSNNIPGSRYSSISWIDSSNNNLWLFGGYGFKDDGQEGYLNDLWSYLLNLPASPTTSSSPTSSSPTSSSPTSSSPTSTTTPTRMISLSSKLINNFTILIFSFILFLFFSS